jgi:lysophospholipid acyltransferase (LPLAT)-like uncharacterized protein
MPTEYPINSFKRFVLLKMVPALTLCLIRSVYWTWRIHETGREHLDAAVEAPEPVIVGFFHGRTFVLLRHMTARSNGKWVSMCSKSLDGEAMAKVEERLGLVVVRGSSGRDGLEAIQEMIRLIRKSPGYGAGLAVDGSRGPRGHVQGGIVRMARWTGGCILPITASCKSAFICRRSWDRTMLPYPFAKIEIAYGQPIPVPSKLNGREVESIRAEVEIRLLELQRVTDTIAGASDHEPVQEALPVNS